MLLRGSATACHNMCALQHFPPVLLLFVNSPTASSSFPSAFSTARHGLGSINGLVTSHTGFSFGFSDLSSYHNDFLVSDVNDAVARRDINKFYNVNLDDSLLTKITSMSSPTSYTSALAIATTFSAPTNSVGSSSTPRESVFDNMDQTSDLCGITGRSRRNLTSSSTLLATSLTTVTYLTTSTSSSDSLATSRGRDFNPFDDTYDMFGIIDHDHSRLNELHQLIFSSCCELTYDVSFKPSSNKKDRPDGHKIFDTYVTWGKSKL